MKKIYVYCPFALQGFSAGMIVFLGIVTAPTVGVEVLLVALGLLNLVLSIRNEHKMRKQITTASASQTTA